MPAPVLSRISLTCLAEMPPAAAAGLAASSFLGSSLAASAGAAAACEISRAGEGRVESSRGGGSEDAKEKKSAFVAYGVGAFGIAIGLRRKKRVILQPRARSS
jgi:hypothetical protein